MKTDRVVNVLVAAAALVVMLQAGLSALHTSRRPGIPQQYKVGSVIKDSSALGFSKASRTLVLITRSGCHYCSESMGFYESLTATARKHGVRVISVTPEDPKTNQGYLSSHNVTVDDVVNSNAEKILFRGTPTLMVVSQKGEILGHWIGKLTPDLESDVTAAVTTTHS
jgi:peroxiredoxin